MQYEVRKLNKRTWQVVSGGTVIIDGINELGVATKAAAEMNAIWQRRYDEGRASVTPAPQPDPVPVPDPKPDSVPTPAPQPQPVPAGGMVFKRVPLGGGGFVTGGMEAKGVQVIRTDVHNAYVRERYDRLWRPVMTAKSMPPGDNQFGTGWGVYDIALAPSDPNRVYMVAPCAGHPLPVGLYRSDDMARAWHKTKLPPIMVDFRWRGNGRRVVVDPANPDHVIVAGINGDVWCTRDGGESAFRVIGIPEGEGPSIAFDASSPVVSGRSSRWAVVTGNNAPSLTEDGGASFRPLDGGPSGTYGGFAFDGRGCLWVVSREPDAEGRRVWVYDGAWQLIPLKPPGATHKDIAISPHNSDRIVVISEAGSPTVTQDGGKTWSPEYAGGGTREDSKIPWLAWTESAWMTVGEIWFDTIDPDRLHLSAGIGTWWTLFSEQITGKPPHWRGTTEGNDELIVNASTKPPGGPVVVSCQDRAFFAIDGVNYPKTHGPNRDASIRHGWGLDYAPEDPRFIVGIAERGSGYSTDGGLTWQIFAGLPSDDSIWGGNIQALSKTNFVWFPSNNGFPHFTKDGGKTWAKCVFDGLTSEQSRNGWSFLFYTNKHILTKHKSGAVYAYNFIDWGDNAPGGVWKSSDGGATFQHQGRGLGAPGSNGTGTNLLAADVPGHLWFSAGLVGPSWHTMPLYRSVDDGKTWQAVKGPGVGFHQCWSACLGAPIRPGAYQSIYVAGELADGKPEPGTGNLIGGTRGIWRSDDEAATWTLLSGGDYGTLDWPRHMAADPVEHGRLYVGLGSTGVIMGTLAP